VTPILFPIDRSLLSIWIIRFHQLWNHTCQLRFSWSRSPDPWTDRHCHGDGLGGGADPCHTNRGALQPRRQIMA